MKAFNFLKIDLIRCKKQVLMVMGMMVFFGAIFTSAEQEIGFVTGYLFFLAVGFAGQPFNIETQSESGFIDMLPGTKMQRIAGRFLYGILGVAMSAVVGSVMILIYKIRGIELMDHVWHLELGMIGVALFMVALEFVLLYIAGRGKSQQFIAIIQIAPAMLLFFGVYGMVDYFSEHGGINIDWILSNIPLLSGCVAAIGVVALVCAFIAATKITQKRDYA